MKSWKRLTVGALVIAAVGLMGATPTCTPQQQATTIEASFAVAVTTLQMALPYGEAAARAQCAAGKWDAAQCQAFNDNVPCLEKAVTTVLPLLGQMWAQSIQNGTSKSIKTPIVITPAKTSELFMGIYKTLTFEQREAIKAAINSEK